MKIYIVVSECPDGRKGIVGTYIGPDRDYRVQTFENASDAIDLLDYMKHNCREGSGMHYHIHSTDV